MPKVRAPGFLLISLAAAAFLLVATLAACGGGSGGNGGMMSAPGGVMGGGPTGTGATTGTGGSKALFVEHCGSCHTLAAAATSGTAGPNLDVASPSYADVVAVVTKGKGIMPPFANTLTRAQIQAIARYVRNATG